MNCKLVVVVVTAAAANNAAVVDDEWHATMFVNWRITTTLTFLMLISHHRRDLKLDGFAANWYLDPTELCSNDLNTSVSKFFVGDSLSRRRECNSHPRRRVADATELDVRRVDV